MSAPLPINRHAPLERLIRIAQGDSGQCRVVAGFLLAWWNAEEYGGFDLTDVWAVDERISRDMLAVFENLLRCRCYPDSLGYGNEFQIIAHKWRESNQGKPAEEAEKK